MLFKCICLGGDARLSLTAMWQSRIVDDDDLLTSARSFFSGRRPPLISVEAIPFEIVRSRSGGLWSAAYGLGVLCLLVFMIEESGGRIDQWLSVTSALFIVFAAPSLVRGLWWMWRPDALTLSAEGIEYRSLWRVGRWQWREVRNFRLTGGRSPAISFEDHRPARPPIWLAPMKIGTDWPRIPAAGVVRLLNHAKLRFDPADDAQRNDRTERLSQLESI